MRRCASLLLVLAGCGWWAAPGCAGWCAFWQTPGHSSTCCLDDYCPKPLPAIRGCVPCRGPDDYCPKPLPGICPLTYGGVDDYCPRPCPVVPPGYPPWYTCGCGGGRASSCSR